MTLPVEPIDHAKPAINARVVPTDKPCKLRDFGGLYLLVQPNSGKWWRFTYRIAEKENRVSLEGILRL